MTTLQGPAGYREATAGGIVIGTTVLAAILAAGLAYLLCCMGRYKRRQQRVNHDIFQWRVGVPLAPIEAADSSPRTY